MIIMFCIKHIVSLFSEYKVVSIVFFKTTSPVLLVPMIIYVYVDGEDSPENGSGLSQDIRIVVVKLMTTFLTSRIPVIIDRK